MDMKKLLEEVGDAVVTAYAGGMAFKYVDPAINSSIPQLNPTTSGGLGANAKYAKAGIYSIVGILADYFLGDKDGALSYIGKYGSEFFYGLGAATIAADPVTLARYQPAPAATPANIQITTYPTGSVIS
jgi:hypothetical protein